MDENTSEKNHIFQNKQQEEIDIKKIINIAFRNKKIVGAISFIFFFFGLVISSSMKTIWQGEFQIVLNNDLGKKLDNIKGNGNLKELVNFQENEDLKTEVGILESPSILLPIFEFVASKKEKEKKLTFTKWEKSLDIELEKGTSILNISYQDNNKDLIIPVLEKISFAYQEYSGKKRKRELSLTKTYLLDQIPLFKEKSKRSIKLLQEFAIEQDLFFAASESEDFPDMRSINIEQQRVLAANEVRKLDSQIEEINSVGDDLEKIIYLASTIPNREIERVSQKLSAIQTNLSRQREIYKEEDIKIQKILKEKKVFIEILKEKLIGYLKAQRLKAQSIIKASTRAKGVLLRYKELIRNASRDELTLVELENNLRKLELEEAKLEDPWELITNPTITKPVGPSKKNYSFIGFLIGSLIGISYSTFREKKTDKIFEIELLESKLSLKSLAMIVPKDFYEDTENIKYFRESINSYINEKVYFISLDDFVESKVKQLTNDMSKINQNKKINFVNSFEELKNLSEEDIKIVFTSLGNTTFAQIEMLNKYLKLYEVNLSTTNLVVFVDVFNLY